MARKQLEIRKYFCLFLLSITLYTTGNGQSDTTYSLVRGGEQAQFTFRKSISAGQYRDKGLVFPQYSMNARQFKRMMQLLDHFITAEFQYERLKSIQASKDSLVALRESDMGRILENERLRADNFQNSYERLLGIHEQLDHTLRKCETMAQSNQKRTRRRVLMASILAGVAGFLVGEAL